MGNNNIVGIEARPTAITNFSAIAISGNMNRVERAKNAFRFLQVRLIGN